MNNATASVLASFAAYQQHRNFSSATIRCRRAVLAAFALHVSPNTILAATPSDVEEWLASRSLGAQGRYTYLAHLHAFYGFATRRGLTRRDPTAVIDRPRLPKRLPRPITPDELDAALRAAEPRMRAWLYLGAYAGLRRAEIAALRVEDVDQAGRTLRVTNGKGAKDGIVPLNGHVFAALVACGLPQRGPVFLRLDGRRAVSAAYVGDTVARFLRSAGVNRTCHSLRHHFGTESYRLCRDLMLTKDLLRHTSIATSAQYVALDPSPQARSVVDGLGA